MGSQGAVTDAPAPEALGLALPGVLVSSYRFLCQDGMALKPQDPAVPPTPAATHPPLLPPLVSGSQDGHARPRVQL